MTTIHLFWTSLLILSVVAAKRLRSSTDFNQQYEPVKSLTLDQFNTILLTEVKAEFGVDRHSSNVSEEMWQASMEQEWSLAKIEEDTGEMHGRRRLERGKPHGYLPFVICDVSGRNGETCKNDIESRLENTVIPIYNKVGMSCFAIESLPSIVSDLPSHFVTAPMSVEMKLQRDLVDLISDSNPIPGRFEVVFCGGETFSKEDALDLANDIFQNFFGQSNSRKLRQDAFLRTRSTRDDDRSKFWHRQLLQHQQEEEMDDGDDDDNVCQDMLRQIKLQATQSGGMMTLTLPLEYRVDNIRHCLHSMVVDMAMQSEVCFVGGHLDMTPSNTVASAVIQSGEYNKDSKPLYDVGLDGTGQVVAVSDSGLDTDNCYFWDQSNAAPKDFGGTINRSARKVIQYVAFADDEDTFFGHGTHVAGTIAGRKSEDGISESDGHDGIARAAKIAFFDVGQDGNTVLNVPEDVFDLFNPGFVAGARIHSSSWGVMNNDYTTVDRAIDEYVHSEPDFLFVTAVGNLGFLGRRNTVGSPAICKNGLTVGSTFNAPPHIEDGMGGPDYLASFSSRGPTADGRISPHVVAPGMYIKSAKAVPTSRGECDETIPEGVDFKSGTSMSAPVVAGAAALIRQYFMDGWYPEGVPDSSAGFSPRASLIKAILLNGGQDLLGIENEIGERSYTEPYDFHQGFGRIDLLQSLRFEGKNQIRAIAVNSEVISNGGHDEYEVINDWSNECTKPLSVTLAWTDPEGAAMCADCVLNDLDLYVTQQGDSRRYYPNGLDSPDSTNNVERVRIITPEDGGRYTIHVAATDLIGRQEYSLIIAGCLHDEESGSGPPISSWTPVPTPSRVPQGQPSPTLEPGFLLPDPMVNCHDTPGGRINVSIDRLEDCTWLSRNPYMYGYLCEFIDIAKECPHTCQKCEAINSLPTGNNHTTPGGFDGIDRWYGNIFSIEAKKDITITGIDIHINRKAKFDVEILTRPGQYDRQQLRGTWSTSSSMICNTTVQGRGQGIPSLIPQKAFTSVSVNAGEIQTFYVTLKEPDLLMVRETRNDAVFENEDVVILAEGAAVSYFDGKAYPNYSWNGRLRYELSSSTSSSPSLASSSPTCEDKPGNVLINNYIGSRSCDWIGQHLDRLNHVCNYVEPAVHCPKTCGVCDDS